MLRKTLIALAAVATIATVSVTTQAEARGGWHGGGYRGGGYHGGGWNRGGRGIGLGVGLGLLGAAGVYGAYNSAYGSSYAYGGDCYRPRRVWTGYGWRVRRVYVCG